MIILKKLDNTLSITIIKRVISLARPRKWRQVCSLPERDRYGPLNSEVNKEHFITMTVDEYETIRLIDLEGLKQEECAEQMNIARTTVQGIYISARKKLAESLINGKVLRIEGGEYEICNGRRSNCRRKKCFRHCKGDSEKAEEEQ